MSNIEVCKVLISPEHDVFTLVNSDGEVIGKETVDTFVNKAKELGFRFIVCDFRVPDDVTEALCLFETDDQQGYQRSARALRVYTEMLLQAYVDLMEKYYSIDQKE